MPESKHQLAAIMPVRRNFSGGGSIHRIIAEGGVTDILVYAAIMDSNKD